MCAFNHPSARAFDWFLAFFLCFLAAGLYFEFVVVQAAGGLRRKANISRISAERLYRLFVTVRPRKDNGGKSGA